MTDRSELAERLVRIDATTHCLICLSGPERDLIVAALRSSALPSEEEIAWALCCGPKQGHCNAAVHADGISPDAYAERNCEGEEIRKQARAVLALLGKTGEEK